MKRVEIESLKDALYPLLDEQQEGGLFSCLNSWRQMNVQVEATEVRKTLYSSLISSSFKGFR